MFHFCEDRDSVYLIVEEPGQIQYPPHHRNLANISYINTCNSEIKKGKYTHDYKRTWEKERSHEKSTNKVFWEFKGQEILSN